MKRATASRTPKWKPSAAHWWRARLGPSRPLIALAAIVLLSALVLFVQASIVNSRQNSVTQAALTYGRQQMVWIKGPAAVSTHVIKLRNLRKDLRAEVSPSVWQDVNVPELLRQYGPSKQVGLVVLSGVFNSLPPDEGVDVHADVVVLVDVRTNRGFYLMD